MQIKEVTSFLENIAPLSSQASYDNCGLIVGDSAQEITGVLVCLDCTEEILEEAIELGANLIIAHHPIVFKGLKKFNGKNYVERTVIKAIKNDLAIYAIHTNLDHSIQGVNAEIARRLEIDNPRILLPNEGVLSKLAVFCPKDYVSVIEKALFDEDFRRFVREIENPYGVGNSAETIVNLLKKIDLKQVSIQKVFYEEQ